MHTLKDSLHASWLEQLGREYRQICYTYRLKLRMPILTIGAGRRRLGSWSDTHRILQLSEQLILKHPWTVTVKVLKHEIGHQICAELLNEPNAGHGPLFRKACRMIGLDDSFCLETADNHQGLANALDPTATEQGRQIIEKVRKLLALSHSDNEHEAALALQRAGEMLVRHRLSMDSLAEKGGFCHLTIDTRQQVVPAYRKSICGLLQECFGVQVILSTLYDPARLRSHKTVELLGRHEETAIASHCWHFLENRLETLWQANKGHFSGHPLRARNSYFLGIVAGFRETLRCPAIKTATPGQNKKTASANTLPAQTDPRLDDFVALRYPRLRRSASTTARLDSRAYNEAMRAGRKLRLRRPVGDREDGAPPRLIPGPKK